MAPYHARARSRHGATLAELLVALTLLSSALALIGRAMVSQWRLHAALPPLAEGGAALREVESALAPAIRGTTPALGDLATTAVTDTALELMLPVAHGVVCRSEGTRLTLAPFERGDGARMGGGLARPQEGDVVSWLADIDAADRPPHWDSAPLNRFTDVTAGCPDVATAAVAGWPAVVPESDRGRRSLRLELASGTSLPPPGTPVRVARRARYSLYRSGDGDHYLGYREWDATRGTFDVVQPVSGPYRPPSGKGIVFRLFDADGQELRDGAALLRLARIEIVARPRPPVVRAAGFDTSREGASARDSIAVTIAVRNRP